MTKKIQILNYTFEGEKDAVIKLEEYISDLDGAFDDETSKEIKLSIIEKIKLNNDKDFVDINIVKRIESEIGKPEKNVYQRFFRSNGFFGVCGGLAQYFGVSVWLVRILFLAPFISFFILNPIYDYSLTIQFYNPLDPLVLALLNSMSVVAFLATSFYVFSLITIPKAVTEEEQLELKGTKISDEIILQAIKNKLNYKSNFIWNGVVKVVFFGVKLGLFVFDYTLQIINSFVAIVSLVFLVVSGYFLVPSIFGFFHVGYIRLNNPVQDWYVSSFLSSSFFDSDINFWVGLSIVPLVFLSWFVFWLLMLLKAKSKVGVKKILTFLGVFSLGLSVLFAGLYVSNIHQIEAQENISTRVLGPIDTDKNSVSIVNVEESVNWDVYVRYTKSDRNEVVVEGDENIIKHVQFKDTIEYDDKISLFSSFNLCYFCNEIIVISIYASEPVTLNYEAYQMTYPYYNDVNGEFVLSVDTQDFIILGQDVIVE